MLKVLDLFSGIGGFSYGLELTGGFKTIAFCEVDKYAHQVLKKHWPDTPIFNDVSLLNYHDGHFIYDAEVHFKGNIDVICGGFPCQDISVANTNGDGLNGKRSGLWNEYKRLIKEIKPRYAIIENVANLRGKGLATVLKDLWQIGYDCEWHIIPACSVGACHKRERIWIIAYPRSKRSKRVEKLIINNKELLQKKISITDNQSFIRGSNEQFSITNCDHIRLWKPFASEKEKQYWWTKTTSSVSYVFGKINEIKPTIHRSNDGISDRLDERLRKQRIKQLGNSVVPQIVTIIGKAILEYENK